MMTRQQREVHDGVIIDESNVQRTKCVAPCRNASVLLLPLMAFACIFFLSIGSVYAQGVSGVFTSSDTELSANFKDPADGVLNADGDFIPMGSPESGYWGDNVTGTPNRTNNDYNKSLQAAKTGAGFDPDKVAQVDPKQITASSTLANELSITQMANINQRLSSLRGGAGSMSLADSTTGPEILLADLTLLAASDASPEVMSTGNSAQIAGKLGVFINAGLLTGDVDSTSQQTGFDFDAYGVTLGADYLITSNVVFGLAAGYSTTEADLESSKGDVEVDGYSFSIYSMYYIDKFYVNGIAGYGMDEYDTVRNFSYSGTIPTSTGTVPFSVSNTGKGNFDADAKSIGLGAGYDFDINAFSVGPFAKANYTHVEFDGYTEETDINRSGFSLGMEYDGYETESFITNLGVRSSYTINTSFAVILPQVLFNWSHEFSNDSEAISARLANASNTNQFSANKVSGSFVINTDDPDRDFYNAGAGISAVFPRGKTVFVNYETVLGLDDVTAHIVSLGARIEI